MRQLTQTPADDKLGCTSESMRYGACTDNDIAFLESRVAGSRPGNPKLNTAAVRNVFIITACNCQKDTLNKFGAERFARDTNQELVDFCSVDRISARSVGKRKLSLCLGMPVMLRTNDATEMCMTKGQEGVVCGWHSSEGPAGQQVLETLFVRLINPPRKINDLPENIISLVRTIMHLTCSGR
ncbi:hypothetical protein B0H13DRAFT_2240677 [Mycena leptocephala]|nr:hypothetical protein B0H13DRAFT_2240677 [Mycena leptocephala]